MMTSLCRRPHKLFLATAVAALIAGAIASHALSRDMHPARVDAPAGPMEGLKENGTVQFRGIPYAKPPVGDLRWRPPVAEPRWSAVRDATKFGAQCAQINTLATFAGPPNNNEDCLYLNVAAPGTAAASARLPVIVWFHGGGNFTGAADAYDPGALVNGGHVVVVTLNYRLGVLGWLAHPDLDAEGHPFANYGLLDQQMALAWVEKNISAFGGDPGNVTIAGQSAGSFDVQAHMASPLAKGLFHKAIMESGVEEAAPLKEAEALGVRFSEEAGCGNDTQSVACLRRLPVERLMAVQGTAGKYPTNDGVVADGTIVPAEGLKAVFEDGKFSHVPVLSSTMRDEWNFLTGVQQFISGRKTPLTASDYEKFVVARAGGSQSVAESIRKHYPLSEYRTPQLAVAAIGTQGGPWFQCATRDRLNALSKVSPVYAYQFNDRTAPSNLPAMEGFEPLADHTADIQYLFRGFRGGPSGVSHPLNAEQTRLSNTLIAAWTRFARSGSPDEPDENAWPKYNRTGKPAVVIADLDGMTTVSDDRFAADNQCEFWESLAH
ncbi:MAG TPA: carboxylesterase family protein [Rhizobium sp.]